MACGCGAKMAPKSKAPEKPAKKKSLYPGMLRDPSLITG